MIRSDVINALMEKFQYKSYLEIGIQDPKLNFDLIKAQEKVGVDPDKKWKADFIMTSDEYFAKLPDEKKFDLIFIDGLHLEKQVIKDIGNSILHLFDNGTIVIHDCNPLLEDEQIETYNPLHYVSTYAWLGTTWKAYARFRMMRTDISMFVVNTDCGVGIIRKGKQELYPFQEIIDWKFLEKHRKELLNLKEISEFQDWLEKI